MHLHLPIAQMVIDPLLFAAIGAGVGVISGLFGVGGGFLLTPLLMFNGVPPAVAVSTQANQVLATSVAGSLAHLRHGRVDLSLGNLLAAGGLVGSLAGVWLFRALLEGGQIEQVIAGSYTMFLGIIGSLMLWESIGAMARPGHGDPRHRSGLRLWTRVLPFRRKFPVSGVYMSVIPPILIGLLIGVLAAIMGVGGGFILAPAMVYLLGVPTRVMVGTSLYCIVFLTALVTWLHASINQTVDALLALVLMAGGVLGAPVGAELARRVGSAQLRLLLAAAVLLVAARVGYDVFQAPEIEYRLETAR